MDDIEKVVKGLENCSTTNGNCQWKEHQNCPYVERCKNGDYSALNRDALKLLKGTDTVKYALETLKRHGWKDATEEQREMIEFAKIFMSDEVHETAKQFRQQLVRCKDCKYWEHTPENATSYWKPCDEIKTEPHYYCWCGERKE